MKGNILNGGLLKELVKSYNINVDDSQRKRITIENGEESLSVAYPEGIGEFEDRMNITFLDNSHNFRSLNAFYLKTSREARNYKELWEEKIQPKYFAKRIFLKDKKFHDMPAERKLIQKTEGIFNYGACEIEIENYWPMYEDETNGPIGISVSLAGNQFFAENLSKEKALKDAMEYLAVKGSLKEVVDDTIVKIDEVPDFLGEVKSGKLITLRGQFPSKTEAKEGWLYITKNVGDGKDYSYVFFNRLVAGQAREVMRKLSSMIKEPSGFSLDFSVYGSSEGHYHAGNFPDEFYEFI